LPLPRFITHEQVTADLGAPLIDGDGARDYYRTGYFNCARESAEALRLRRGSNRSAMPVLFLCRHYLEIALKDALHLSNAFDLNQSEERFGHNLERLWSETKRVLLNFVDTERLSEIDEAVSEFAEVDSRADAFRYPLNSRGDHHFEQHGFVLIDQLVRSMDATFNVLEHAVAELRHSERMLDAEIDAAVARNPY
jgi:hypothetical protein